MFETVFIEKSVIENKYAQHILKKVKYKNIFEIERIEDIWGRVKKPYLQKRDNLNLFIGYKKGIKVKEAPPAYGHGKEKHYYFIHSYNCIYECQYCYLQGHFHSPDLVFFVNHHEILKEMEQIAIDNPDSWFHAGEFSDSLALSHITNELSDYFDFFKKHQKAKLELRTKSVNIKTLLNLKALPNIFVSFTLSSELGGKLFDNKCPSVLARISAIKKLVYHGYQIGIHFDPIIYQENFESDYKNIISHLREALPDSQLGYISLGVVRFTKNVFKEVEKNYPKSKLIKQDYITSFDGKVRYSHPMRMWMLNKIKQELIHSGYSADKIYLCMEND